MPFCEASNGVRIYYRKYGQGSTKVLLIIGTYLFFNLSPTKLCYFFVFHSQIGMNNAGLAGTHDSWGPQIKGLTGSIEPSDNDDLEAAPCASPNLKEGSNLDQTEEEDEEGIEICCFDNRGMGRSSVPINKSDYKSVPLPPPFHFSFFFK